MPGRMEFSEWCSPDTLPLPTLAGERAVQVFTETFDAVVTDLATRAGPLTTTISGGLDSTFMAASLVRNADTANPVRSYCFSPLEDATIDPSSDRLGDELPHAELMEVRYPGILAVHPLRNTELVRPLAAAAAASRKSWLPTLAPATSVWIGQYQERVAERGASLGFIGVHGNASFSFDHGYHLSARRRFRRAVAQVGTRPVADLPGGGTTRADFLSWLTGRRAGFVPSGSPAATGGRLLADPFGARPVLEVAASITPRTWQHGGFRGFARAAGAGRVPDAIRLERRRGLQTSDVWHVIRNDRDEYLERADAVAAVPGLEEYGGKRLVEEVSAWPWGQVLGPSPRDLARIHRVLALADFARSVGTRGSALGGLS